MPKIFSPGFLFWLWSISLFSAPVQEEWVARYNGPENRRDRATALAVDGQGNVYVTGLSDTNAPPAPRRGYYTTVKYNPQGTPLWADRYGDAGRISTPTAVAVDAAGCVYVTGQHNAQCDKGCRQGDAATVKYSPEGRRLWAATYSGIGRSDSAQAVTVDDQGHVYVIGRSCRSSSCLSSDVLTIKYDTHGRQLWAAHHVPTRIGLSGAIAIAVDADGYVYVAGYSPGGGNSSDYITIKYDADGDEVWAASYDGPAGGNDEARALALDSDGNVYVTGHSRGPDNQWDYATIKYDAGGNEVWVARYDGPAHGNDYAVAIALDIEGHIYVTGRSQGLGTQNDYATVKYDGDGNQLWAARYDGPASGEDTAQALALDAGGYVYVTGASEGGGTGLDYATIKYDADGREIWVIRYDGPGSGRDSAAALALDADGNVYVTGESLDKDTGASDFATIKYSQ